jgi:rhodanese-related sulfurtransferase
MLSKLLTALTALLALLTGGCASPSNEAAAPGALPKSIDVPAAAKLRDEGAVVIDVREQSEWDEFHMPGATLIPLGQIGGRLDAIPKDKPVVLVCRSGSRSASARDQLINAGYTNVTSMDGGMLAWRRAGQPVTP